MRGEGINYDTGFYPGGVSTREHFDPSLVGREMRVIADDLHCTAVRISGGDPGRLSVAGVVSMVPGGPGSGYRGLGWEPRLAFGALARADWRTSATVSPAG
jgi:hypothetical protein